MPEPDPPVSPTAAAAPRRRLGLLSGEWWYVCSLYGPLLLVDLLTQASRSHTLGIPVASWQFAAALRPTLAFGVGLIAFWALCLVATRRRRARLAVAIALHVSFTVLAILVVLNHLYFLNADVLLNGHSFQLLTLLADDQILEVVKGEVSPLLLVLSFGVILLGNVIPPLLNRWFEPRWLTRPVPPRDAGEGGRRRPAALLAGAVCLLMLLAALPNATGFYRSNRSPAVAMALDAVSAPLAEQPPGFVEPTLADLPRQTRLVAREGEPHPNVVLLVVESLGAGATTVYDPDLDTTPTLAALAEESVVADRAYTVIPHTTKALISAHCGVAPPPDTFDDTADEDGGIIGRCLPELLAEQGYATAYFQSATGDFEERGPMVDQFGFEEFHPLEDLDTSGFSKVNAFGYEDDIMVEPSIAWAQAQEDPFLLSYLTVTTHYDYTLPEGFEERHYSDDPVENRYLNAVRYSDRFVGKVIDGFKRAGLYDDTVFIITGDHGEAFYEHGRRSHNNVIWSEGLQVPMLIHSAQTRRDPGRITKPVQLPAILPTVTDLLGFDIAGGTYPQPSMLDPEAVPLFATCWDAEQCVSLIEGDHKVNHFFGYRPDEYFEPIEDPHEEHDLVDELTDDELADYQDRMLRWLAELEAAYALSREAGQS